MRVTASELCKENCRLAKLRWPDGVGAPSTRATLKALSRQFQMSVALGDLLLLNHCWYVTHSGLLRLSRQRHCRGIQVRPVLDMCNPSANRYAFEATVYTSATCKGFSGYGDADPSNVSDLVHGAEMRMAETRAVNRALRKAYGIGICSLEELPSGHSTQLAREAEKRPAQPVNGNGYGGPRVRDQLCQIIRQHQLDPTLVKSYATDFCSVKSLREASREQVESFVAHLADWAEKDRNALLCQLNSYLGQKEGAA